jgi:hypothetical protein
MEKPPYTAEQLEFFKRAGQKGGRPAKVSCTGKRGCRCANCRRARGENGTRLDLPKTKAVKQTAAAIIDVDFTKE